MSELLPPACVDPDRYLVELAFDETSNVPAEIQAHIAGCERCTRTLNELKEARGAADLPLEEPSSSVDANILAALDVHLAGEKIDHLVKLPEPERALGAERLVRHLSQPPAARARVAEPIAEPTPVARPIRARRRWPAAFAAAASVVIAGGGALYLHENAELDLEARPQAAAAIAEEAKAGRPEEKQEGEKEFAKDKAAPAKEDSADRLQAAAAPPPAAFRENAVAQPKTVDEKLAKVSTRDERRAAKREAAAPDSVRGFGVGGLMDGAGGGSDVAGAGLSAGPRDKVYRQATPPPAPSAPPPAPVVVATPQAAPMPMEAEEPRAMKKKVERRSDSLEQKVMNDSEGDAQEPAWSSALTKARSAASRRDHRTAAQAFAEVLASGDAPSNVEQEALKGQVDALLALHRFDEAQAVADRLASRFPAQASARARVDQAKASAAAASTPAAAEAAPAAKPAETQKGDQP